MQRSKYQLGELQQDIWIAQAVMALAKSKGLETANMHPHVLANIVDFAADVLAEIAAIEAMQRERAGNFQPKPTTKEVGNA